MNSCLLCVFFSVAYRLRQGIAGYCERNIHIQRTHTHTHARARTHTLIKSTTRMQQCFVGNHAMKGTHLFPPTANSKQAIANQSQKFVLFRLPLVTVPLRGYRNVNWTMLKKDINTEKRNSRWWNGYEKKWKNWHDKLIGLRECNSTKRQAKWIVTTTETMT